LAEEKFINRKSVKYVTKYQQTLETSPKDAVTDDAGAAGTPEKGV
jgi:hypothetical protein